MKKNKLFLMLFFSVLIGTVSTSCDKDDDNTENELTIRDDEKQVLTRFEIPEGIQIDQITFTGTLYEFEIDETNIVSIESFTIDNNNIPGVYRKYIIPTNKNSIKGEPVPGAEIIIEQEPNDDPVPITVTTDPDNGTFTIVIDNPNAGNWVIKCTSITTKGGFAIGGFNAT